MGKKLVINTCDDCPFFDHIYNICSNTEVEIIRNIIPEDCPLEDVQSDLLK